MFYKIIQSINEKAYFFFDTIKFLLIFLVVFGHVIPPYRQISWNSEIYSFIYLFHMPLFIIISGAFSGKKEDITTFKKDQLYLFEVFCSLHLLSIIYKFFVNGKLSLSDLFVPGFASWYLLILIFWRCFIQIMPAKWLKTYYLIGASIVVSLIAGFIPIGGVCSVQRTLSMFPFFLLGYVLKHNNYFERRITKQSLCIAYFVVISITVIIILYNDIFDIGEGKNMFHNVTHCCYHYYKGDDFIKYPLLFRLFFLIISTIMSLAIITIIPRREFGVITKEGQYTLFYYFWHMLIINLLRPLLAYANAEVYMNSLFLFATSVFVFTILYFMRRIRLFTLLMNPVSNMMKLIK